MEYLKVSWIHDLKDEPILLYSEIDENRFEVRKIEIYKDDSFGLAMSAYNFGGTLLGLEPLPDISEIANDSQFIPQNISKDEFEEVWLEYTSLLGIE
jgi:hypothetical protein